MALAVIDAVRYCAISSPGDVAIAGFEDISMASCNSHRLTNVRQPVEKMVQGALKLIDDANMKPPDDCLTRLLSGELVVAA